MAKLWRLPRCRASRAWDQFIRDPRNSLLGMALRAFCHYEPSHLRIVPGERRGYFLLPFVGVVGYRIRTFGHVGSRFALADPYLRCPPPWRPLRERMDEAFIRAGIRHDDSVESLYLKMTPATRNPSC